MWNPECESSIRVDDVPLHAVEPGRSALLHAIAVHLEDERALPLVVVDVQEELVREDLAERVADQAAVACLVEVDEALVVGAVRLGVAGVQVADRMAARRVDRVDGGRVHHEVALARDLRVDVEVDVEHLRRHAVAPGGRRLADVDVDAAGVVGDARLPLELVLPARDERRQPAPGARLRGRTMRTRGIGSGHGHRSGHRHRACDHGRRHGLAERGDQQHRAHTGPGHALHPPYASTR